MGNQFFFNFFKFLQEELNYLVVGTETCTFLFQDMPFMGYLHLKIQPREDAAYQQKQHKCKDDTNGDP